MNVTTASEKGQHAIHTEHVNAKPIPTAERRTLQSTLGLQLYVFQAFAAPGAYRANGAHMVSAVKTSCSTASLTILWLKFQR